MDRRCRFLTCPADACLMVVRRTRPSREILSGESADVYFARAERILEREGLDPS